MLASYFKTVFLRKDMLTSLSDLLTKGAVESFESQTTKDKFGEFIKKVAKNPEVKQEFYQNYLVKPAKRFFSFGVFGDEE